MNSIDTTLRVTGMTCGACVKHVDRALRALPFVQEVEVDLRAGTVRVKHDRDASLPALTDAVREAGYKVS